MKDLNKSLKACIKSMWKNIETLIIWSKSWRNTTKLNKKNLTKLRRNSKKSKRKSKTKK